MKDGKTDDAVKLIEQTRVCPLGKKDSAPAMVFPNASTMPGNMLVTQDISCFEKLKQFIDPTDAGRAWFRYFRLCSPTHAFLDQTWVLPDIEESELIRQSQATAYGARTPS